MKKFRVWTGSLKEEYLMVLGFDVVGYAEDGQTEFKYSKEILAANKKLEENKKKRLPLEEIEFIKDRDKALALVKEGRKLFRVQRDNRNRERMVYIFIR